MSATPACALATLALAFWRFAEPFSLRESSCCALRRRRLHNPDGSPPYTVHWLDEEKHETLFFPGPEAHIEHRPGSRREG
ncbi:DUF1918 domain-containing protein [Sphaerimonospora sp. CA-214678]|uniref:DUF1918 domain-containing protein n=1 Tax=Sphaerimonospora sp. CA-214678 TaxID=3240029 RepID=UPI003D923D67